MSTSAAYVTNVQLMSATSCIRAAARGLALDWIGSYKSLGWSKLRGKLEIMYIVYQPNSSKRTICAHFTHRNMGSIPLNETKMLVFSGIFELGSGWIRYTLEPANQIFNTAALYCTVKYIGWCFQPFDTPNGIIIPLNLRRATKQLKVQTCS